VCAESDPVITMGSLLFVMLAVGLTYASMPVLEAASRYRAAAANSQLSRWDCLNSTLGGRLHKSTPVSAPCFPVVDHKHITVNSTTCSVIQKSYTNPVFRAPAFGAYMWVSPSSVMNQDRGAVSDTSCDYSPSGRVVNRLGSSASLTRAIRRIL